jgi:hypothetical protein
MTQDEINQMVEQAGFHGMLSIGVVMDSKQLEAFAKLVAAKAIAESESQEPVAWVAEDVCEGQYINGRPRKIWWECKKGVGTAFYAHPPQRTEQNFCPRCGKRLGGIDSIHTCTPPQDQQSCDKRIWVALTDEEVFEICNSNYNRDSELVKMAEAKLKQKNGYAEEKNT